MLFNNHIKIQNHGQARPYTFKDLLENNKYIHDNILIANSNIIDKLEMLKDNFLSQYFYYAKYHDAINQIHKNNISNTGIGEITNTILKSLGHTNPMPQLMHLYPNNYSTKIPNIGEIFDTPNDFTQGMLEHLSPFLSSLSPPMLTIHDISDIINL